MLLNHLANHIEMQLLTRETRWCHESAKPRPWPDPNQSEPLLLYLFHFTHTKLCSHFLKSCFLSFWLWLSKCRFSQEHSQTTGRKKPVSVAIKATSIKIKRILLSAQQGEAERERLVFPLGGGLRTDETLIKRLFLFLVQTETWRECCSRHYCVLSG